MTDVAAQIRQALKDILRFWDATLEPGKRATSSPVQTSGEPPLPIGTHVLDVRAQCRSVMAGWCLLTMDERELHTEHLSGLDVVAMADLLDRHAGWLGEHQAAKEVAAELAWSAREIETIAMDNRPRRFKIGQCPAVVTPDEGEPHPCTGTLKVTLRNSDGLLPSEIRCSLDKDHRWSTGAWMTLGRTMAIT